MTDEEFSRQLSEAIRLSRWYDVYLLAAWRLRQRLETRALHALALSLYEQGKREEALVACLFCLALVPDDQENLALLSRIKDPTTTEAGKERTPLASPPTESPATTVAIHDGSIEKRLLYSSADEHDVIDAYLVPDCTVLGPEAIPIVEGKVIVEPGISRLAPHLAAATADTYLRALSATGKTTDEIPFFNGELLTLVDRWSGEFWHWFAEQLPLVVAAEEAGYEGCYLVPRGGPYVMQSLELVGVERKRVVEYTVTALRVKLLIVPPRPRNYLAAGTRVGMLLRDRLLSECAAEHATPRRIYISRNGSPQLPRKIANEEPLLKLLDQYGFERQVLETLSLREQIAMMSQATAVVAPHGAGMLHTLFMPQGSVVIELFPASYINPCMLDVIETLDHRYHMIPSYSNHADPITNPEAFAAFLKPLELALRRELRT